jgi:hypothetical protein
MKWARKLWAALGARRWLILAALGPLLVAPFYGAQQLLAAEVLFAVLFLLLIAFAVVLYFLGALLERGADATESGMRAAARRAWAGFHDVEATTLRWLHDRHLIHAQK